MNQSNQGRGLKTDATTHVSFALQNKWSKFAKIEGEGMNFKYVGYSVMTKPEVQGGHSKKRWLIFSGSIPHRGHILSVPKCQSSSRWHVARQPMAIFQRKCYSFLKLRYSMIISEVLWRLVAQKGGHNHLECLTWLTGNPIWLYIGQISNGSNNL